MFANRGHHKSSAEAKLPLMNQEPFVEELKRGVGRGGV